MSQGEHPLQPQRLTAGGAAQLLLLGLGPQDNIVTDRFDATPSVLAALEQCEGPADAETLAREAERIFAGADTAELLNVRGPDQQARLHTMKEQPWLRFNYDAVLLSAMRGASFWDEQARAANAQPSAAPLVAL